MKRLTTVVTLVAFVCSGCVSTLRTSAQYPQNITQIKTIAVLPPDVEMYKFTAGNQTELIDEWSDEAKRLIKQALKTHLGERYQFEVKFIEEDWLKSNYSTLWTEQKALYNAVSLSASLHALPGCKQRFPTKKEVFDYTLGPNVNELAQAVEADMLLFLYGFDYVSTAGRNTRLVFQTLVFAAAAAYTGILIMPQLHTPTTLKAGLVHGATGDLDWFKVSREKDMKKDFRKEKHVDKLISWMMEDLIEEDEKE